MPSVRVRNRGYSVIEPTRREFQPSGLGPFSSLAPISRTLRIRRSLPDFLRRTDTRLSNDQQDSQNQHAPESAETSALGTPPQAKETRPAQEFGPNAALAQGILNVLRMPPNSQAVPFQQATSTDARSREAEAKGSTSQDGGEPHSPLSRLAAALGITESHQEYHDRQVVDHLDVIDPQVAWTSTLSDVSNCIVVPPLPFYNRAPVIELRTAALPATVATRAVQTLAEGAGVASSDSQTMQDIDEHVATIMRQRASFKRSMHGVWAFLKTPTGIFTAIYGFLCAFWGAAIVLFLGKLINLHNPDRQGWWVELSSQIENGLFTLTGVGLIPWRAIDTYRIVRIYRYKRLVRRLRQKAGLPPLLDENDLPDPALDPGYVHVLTPKQLANMHIQQEKFAKSQTWYRPHRTETHKAFPISSALWICLLIDGNSLFQCLLCGCMWGFNRFTRPPWTTGTLIPSSFLCGIGAGILIWRVGAKTKRTLQVEERLRAALEKEEAEPGDSEKVKGLREAVDRKKGETEPQLDRPPDPDHDQEASLGHPMSQHS